jgi:peroxiredoxin
LRASPGRFLASVLLATAVFVAAINLAAQGSKAGPKIGETAPDFSLTDQTGAARTLKSVLGPNGAILVFFRSADWCPYCKTQLVELQEQRESARQRGLGLAAISYDARETLTQFAARRGITFPLLSDKGSAVIKRYGLLNETIAATSTQFGVPHPGTFVLDASGRVTARYFEDAYQRRETLGGILVKLGDSGQTAAAVSDARLDVRAGISATTVAPGHRFSLVLDLRPKRGIHVYAPGNDGYQTIKTTIAAQPHVIVHPIDYPPSQELFFQPLNERWKVYDRPFRLVQDVTLDASTPAQSALRNVTQLTISGTLDYQACDDRVCYPPGSIPLTWTVGVKPLDRERQ